MKELSLEERKQILLDCQVMTAAEVREKWHITNNTLGHIRFFHGKSNAVARGYYHKDLLAGTVHSTVAQIQDLKFAGHNSAEIASMLNIELEVVNKNW